jgi:2-succinyl-5-enolpyruvyl-6-hydroxy-3-cyclohexene-1-carboxylate synthase
MAGNRVKNANYFRNDSNKIMSSNKPQTNNAIGTLNYQWAFSLVHYFFLQGVTQAVISPGSRSTPLALACEKHPDINTWIQVDERCAGFFALGLAQKQQQAVILICTSGSAVANWFPAVVEANHSYTPLLLLSADRPAELQHCGANQTIEQHFLFGSHVRDFIALEHADKTLLDSNYLKRITTQAYNKACQQKPGPVHINIPLREPLLPRRFTAEELNQTINRLSQQTIQAATTIIQSNNAQAAISDNQNKQLTQRLNSGNGLIICGRLTANEQLNLRPVLSQLAKQLNCPVIIDQLSGLRFTTQTDSHFIYNYDHFLKNSNHIKQLKKPAWIIQIGQFPVSKNLLIFLQSIESHTILVSSYGDTFDPIQKAQTILHTFPLVLFQQLIKNTLIANNEQWLSDWQAFEQRSEAIINTSYLEDADNNDFLHEGHVITELLQQLPDNSVLFSGNSMAIRDFDTYITSASSKQNQQLYCNRGSSGIDGNLSTFLGLLAENPSCYGVAVLGDLSFYHDMNGLLMAKQLDALAYNATIIVINNNGGGIFNYLPQQQLEDFDKLWNTATDLNFAHSAQLYNLAYHRVTNLSELKVSLQQTLTKTGIQLVEVIINQDLSVAHHKQLNAF